MCKCGAGQRGPRGGGVGGAGAIAFCSARPLWRAPSGPTDFNYLGLVVETKRRGKPDSLRGTAATLNSFLSPSFFLFFCVLLSYFSFSSFPAARLPVRSLTKQGQHARPLPRALSHTLTDSLISSLFFGTLVERCPRCFITFACFGVNWGIPSAF